MKKKLFGGLAVIFLIIILSSNCVFGATGQDMVNFIKGADLLGKPYSSSNRLGPNSFDCSGFVWYVCSNVGIDMSSGNTSSQLKYGTAVDHSSLKSSNDCSNLQIGDLIFFDYGGDGITDHVAIYSGNGNVIHAITRGVTENPLTWTTGMASGQMFYQAACAVRRVANSSSTHTHSYGGAYYEAAHPHREYQICGCGATRYTGATGYMSSCSVCNPPLTVAKWVECKRYCAVNSGQTVNLYKNPTDTSRSDYFSKGQKFWSWRYAVLSNRTIRYEVETANNGIMYFDETGKMSVNVIHTTTAGRGCDAAHPHARYSLCECGYKEYTGAYDTVADCDICNPSYTLTYDANGGSGAPQPQKYKKNDSVSVSSAIPYKEGAVFLGWANSPTATTAAYVGGDVFTMSGRDTVLYAVWASKQGQCGDNAYYTIDDDWTLTIGGTGDMYDYASELDVPWYNQREQIQKVVMHEGITSIGDYAFYGCTGVGEINIPDGIRRLGDYSFHRFGNNVSVYFPDSISEFGSYILGDTTINHNGIIHIYVPEKVENITSLFTLYHCATLKTIECSSANPYYFVDNGMLISKDKTTLSYRPGSIDKINIPEYVSVLGEKSFSFNINKYINIPDNVIEIEKSAFYNSEFTNILLPESIRFIAAGTFMYSKLNSIIIPNKVEKIDEYAFMRSQICYAVIPDSVQRIATGAFEDCPYLKDIYIENASIVFDANIFNKWPSYVNQFGFNYPKDSSWPFDVTVYAPEGSTAEEHVSQYYQEDWQYTDIKNISFVPLSEAPAPPTPIPTEAPTVNPTAAPEPTTAPTAMPSATEEPIDKPNSDSPSEPDEYDAMIESFSGNEIAITSNFSGAAKLLVAKYRSGMLVDCEIVNLSLSEGSARIPLQNDMTADAGESVKIMIWDTNMRPYNVAIRD